MPVPTPEQIRSLTNTEFDQLRQLMVEDRTRREVLTQTPAAVDAVLQRFADHGGDMTKIRDPLGYKPGQPWAPPA